MVLTRSMVAAAAAMASGKPLGLPHDVVVEIAGHVAASSPRPMHDISSVRASCRAMHAACGESAVGRRVALEREAAAMRWSDNARYRAVVKHLASAGNPEACFLTGLTLVFADRCARPGAACLGRAAAAGHKAAAYVLGLLRYGANEARDAAKYIRQVEGEPAAGDVDENAEYAAKRTNRECLGCRAKAVATVRDVTWNVTVVTRPAPVKPPEDGHGCTAASCGVPQGWSSCAVFCSEGCRMKHEYIQFFSLVSLPVSVHF